MRKNKLFILVISSLVLFFSLFLISFISIFTNSDYEQRKEIQITFEEYYNSKVEQYKIENVQANNIDVVFLGDSLTDGCDVSKYYPTYKCLNRGISGDTTTGLLKRLDESLYQVETKAVVMLIGANNLHNMFDDYEDILKSFQEHIKDVPVIILSLSSMGRDWAKNNDLAIENNIKIKELANKYNYYFIDIYNPLLDEETGKIREDYTTDGGHFTHAGYMVVTSLVNEKLNYIFNLH